MEDISNQTSSLLQTPTRVNMRGKIPMEPDWDNLHAITTLTPPSIGVVCMTPIHLLASPSALSAAIQSPYRTCLNSPRIDLRRDSSLADGFQRATPLNCSQSDDSFFIPGAGEASNLAMDIGKGGMAGGLAGGAHMYSRGFTAPANSFTTRSDLHQSQKSWMDFTGERSTPQSTGYLQYSALSVPVQQADNAAELPEATVFVDREIKPLPNLFSGGEKRPRESDLTQTALKLGRQSKGLASSTVPLCQPAVGIVPMVESPAPAFPSFKVEVPEEAVPVPGLSSSQLRKGPASPAALASDDLAEERGQGDAGLMISPVTPADEIVSDQSGPSQATGSKKCNCKKSKCLKLYCDCFAAGLSCTNCMCTNCSNIPEFKEAVDAQRASIKQRNPLAFDLKIVKLAAASENPHHKRGCNCKKSHCVKKYCECFQAGVPCGTSCKCEECANGPCDPSSGPAEQGDGRANGGASAKVSPGTPSARVSQAVKGNALHMAPKSFSPSDGHGKSLRAVTRGRNASKKAHQASYGSKHLQQDSEEDAACAQANAEPEGGRGLSPDLSPQQLIVESQSHPLAELVPDGGATRPGSTYLNMLMPYKSVSTMADAYTFLPESSQVKSEQRGSAMRVQSPCYNSFYKPTESTLINQSAGQSPSSSQRRVPNSSSTP